MRRRDPADLRQGTLAGLSVQTEQHAVAFAKAQIINRQHPDAADYPSSARSELRSCSKIRPRHLADASLAGVPVAVLLIVLGVGAGAGACTVATMKDCLLSERSSSPVELSRPHHPSPQGEEETSWFERLLSPCRALREGMGDGSNHKSR